jgi:hypothetical protein
MMLPTQTRDLARHLVAYDAVAVKSSEPRESAAFRVCEKLRQPLCVLTGVDGFQSLLSRALTLARKEAPGLRAVHVTRDGFLKDPDGLESQIVGKERAGEGEAVVLIAHLLGLLLLLIGEPLTLRLVTSEVLPDLKFLPNSVGPIGYEAILNEIEQLQGVSARLEGLAEQLPPATEALISVADSVRNAAVVLAVLSTIRSPKPN